MSYSMSKTAARLLVLGGMMLGATVADAGESGGNNWYSGTENGRTLWDSYYGGFNIGPVTQ